MKILFVLPHLGKGGPVFAILAIVKGFFYTYHDEVSVISLGPRRDGDLSSEFSQYGATVMHLTENKSANCFLIPRKLKQVVNRCKPQVIASCCLFADISVLFSTIGRKDIVKFSTVQNIPKTDYRFHFGWVLGSLISLIHYEVLRYYGENVIFVSKAVESHIRDRLGVRGRLVYNPIGFEIQFNQECRIEPVVIYAATLTARKNPEEAIQFFLNASINRKYYIDVYGSGKEEGKLRNRFKNNSRVRWRGFADSLAEVLSGASCYVSSSYTEGLPLTAQIAIAVGCPCVLSDIDQHRELSQDVSHVFLYKHGDEIGFQNALNRALSIDRAKAVIDGEKMFSKISPKNIASKLRYIYYSELVI